MKRIAVLGSTGSIFVKNPMEFNGDVFLAAAEIYVEAPVRTTGKYWIQRLPMLGYLEQSE